MPSEIVFRVQFLSLQLGFVVKIFVVRIELLISGQAVYLPRNNTELHVPEPELLVKLYMYVVAV